MSITVEAFADYIGASLEDREADLTRSLTVASTLVSAELENAFRPMPQILQDQITLDVAYAVFKRNENNAGSVVSQYENTQTLHAPNDPLQQVRPILRKYIVCL